MGSIKFKILFFTLFINSFFASKLTGQALDKGIIAQKSSIGLENQFKGLLLLSKKNRKAIKLDSAIIYAEKALKLAETNNWTGDIAQVYQELSLIAIEQNDFNQAISFNNLAIETTTKTSEFINLNLFKAKIEHRLGYFDSLKVTLDLLRPYIESSPNNVYKIRYSIMHSLYHHCVLNFTEAINIAKKGRVLAKNNPVYFNVINSNLALLYNDINLYDKAIETYEGVKNYCLEHGKEKDLLFALYGLTQAHLSLFNYKIAKKYCFDAIDIKNNINFTPAFGLVYYRLGIIYEYESKPDSAIYYFNQGITISQLQGEQSILMENYVSLGDFYIRQGEWQKAKKQALKAEQIATNIGGDVRGLHNLLAQIYAKEKNFEKAYQYLTKNNDLDLKTNFDSLQNNTIVNLFKEKFEQEKQLEYQILNQEIKNKQLWLILSSIGGLLFFWAYRQSRQKNKLLKKNLRNKEIIEKQTRELQLANQQKNKLFTNIAHEFQTPLSIIQGLGKEIYKTEELTLTGQVSLGIVLKNSEYLTKTTNEILDLNLGNQRRNSNDICFFSLSDLIQYIIPELKFLAKEKSIQLIIPDLEDKEIIINSDVKKLETVLKNLISNAIKYSNKKGVVSLKYIKDKNGPHQITVTDNGLGISKEDLNSIFDRYYQSENENAEGGFGLGLAICKEYTESIGGAIKVRSELGKGSSFTIHFPDLNECEIFEKQYLLYQFPTIPIVQKAQLDTTSKNSRDTVQAKILIVEDNIDYCKFLALILEKDYDLTFAHNGYEAISYLENKKPSLIVTDWMMPEMDGFELIEFLKSKENYHSIPVIMLTARSLVTDKIKALRVGIDDYLIKPIDADILGQRIAYLLNLREDQKDTSKLTSANLEKKNKFISINQDWLLTVERIVTPLLSDFNLNLTQIAKLLNISSKQFNLKITESTGLTAKKYIQEMRYWEARRMLESGEFNSVKLVCFSVGFKDSKNFSRRFKERFGAYPSEFLYKS